MRPVPGAGIENQAAVQLLFSLLTLLDLGQPSFDAWSCHEGLSSPALSAGTVSDYSALVPPVLSHIVSDRPALVPPVLACIEPDSPVLVHLY
jgi:hypothetical protein